MKYYLKGSNGLFFVNGGGFVASAKANASQLTQENLDCLTSLGFTGTKEAVVIHKSFASNYVRPGEQNADGSTKANTKNPSKRRFATFEEAWTHGCRARSRRLLKTDQPGTCNHRGFHVTVTNDPVNANVNPLTGLTNDI